MAAGCPAGGPRAGIAYGDGWLGKGSSEEAEAEIAAFPTRNQTPPQQNHTGIRTWLKEDAIRVTLSGLQRVRSKTLNDAKWANTGQGEKEAPGKYLDRLQEPFADSLRWIPKVQREE